MAIVQKNPSASINDWPNQVMKLLPTNLVLKNFDESRELFFKEQEKITFIKRQKIQHYLSQKEPLKKDALLRGQKASLKRFIVNILTDGIIWRSSIHEEAFALLDIAQTLADKLANTHVSSSRQSEDYHEVYEALNQYFNVHVMLPKDRSPNLNQPQESLYDFLLNNEFLNLKRHDNGPCLRVSFNGCQETFDFSESEIDRIFQRTLNKVAFFF